MRVATGTADAPTWSDAASAPLRVDGNWSLSGTVATRGVTVTNTSAAPVTLVGLEWSSGDGGVGLPVDRMLHDGYQSWSYTGVEDIPLSLADSLGTAPHGGDDENVLGEIAGVSWWWTALADAHGNGVFLGADGGTVLKTFVAADGSAPVRVRIVVGMTGDEITLAPGASRALDGLFVELGDVRASFDDYARAVSGKHPPELPRKPALGGWGSWNEYYATITSGALRSEATYASTTYAPAGLTDFLLDDGYEAHWGSWSASPAFGADLATLAKEQATLGLRPAIWLAPFYVAVSDPMVTSHPDWFVHTKAGALRTYNNVGPDYAALDATHPDARAFVTGAVRQLRDWGFRTLKVDFLFGAAIEGKRQAEVTSLESYALWMKTLREAVPEVHLVGCGAPMLPSVGSVDSMRVGADIAFSNSPTPRYSFLASEARNAAFRASTDAFWSLDPDVVLTRGTDLSDAEAWTVVVFSALTGGNYLLGDAQQTSDVRRAMSLSADVLAIARDGLAARPDDLTSNVDPKIAPSPIFAGADTAVPHVWRKASADGQHGAVGVFGWNVDGYAATVSLTASAEELAAPTTPGPAERSAAGGTRVVTVPLHAARLFVW